MQIILKNQSYSHSGAEFCSSQSPFWLLVKGALLTAVLACTDDGNAFCLMSFGSSPPQTGLRHVADST